MALPTPHFFQIKHSPGIVADVLINDVPFYRRVVDHNSSPAGPVNHLLLKGKNTVTVRLAEPNADPFRVRPFELCILRESDDKVLFRTRWPDFAADYPKDEQKLPIVHETWFDFDEETPAPIWADAPLQSFPSEGTRELHEVVLELHTAYRMQDIDAFLKAMELKTSEFAKFYGQQPFLSPDVARETYGESLRQPWNLAPYDPTKVVFERRANGRAAYARGHEGGPALMALHKTDPAQTWEASLLLARVGDRWRIIW